MKSFEIPLKIIIEHNQAQIMICNYKDILQETNIKQNKDNEILDFQFPPKIFKGKQFSDPNDLNRDILRLAIRLYFWKGRVFDREDFKNSSGVKVVFKCKNKQCNARLVYFKAVNDHFFDPIVFKNQHRHKKYKDLQKAKRQQINLFIIQMRGDEYEQFRKIPKWVERFDITNQEGLYIAEQVYWYNNTEDQILSSLAYEGKTIRRLSSQNQTLLVYITTQSMKRSYAKLGQSVTIELYHQSGKKRRSINKDHAVGYILGQDQESRVVLFGIFLIIQEKQHIFHHLLEFFIQTVCQNNLPNFFITDENKELQAALDRIKKQKAYTYHHLYPWYHITSKFMNKLKQLDQKRAIMELMCKAMQQTDESKYYSMMCQLKTYLRKYPQIFMYFQNREHKLCFRRIPKKFLGFSISTSFGQKVLAQVANSAVYRAHTGRLYHRLLKMESQLKLESDRSRQIPVDVLRYCPYELNIISLRVKPQILQMLLTIFNQAKELQKNMESPIEIKTKQKNSEKQFVCRFSIQFDHWECECQQIVFTGLPCPHIVSIIMQQKWKGSLEYYINTRWLIEPRVKTAFKGPLISNKRRRP